MYEVFDWIISLFVKLKKISKFIVIFGIFSLQVRHFVANYLLKIVLATEAIVSKKVLSFSLFQCFRSLEGRPFYKNSSRPFTPSTIVAIIINFFSAI